MSLTIGRVALLGRPLAVVAVAGSAGTDVVAGFPEVVADSGVGTRAIPKKSLAEWKRGETSSKRRIT
ncbi:MAG TPA: hypothetical protein VFB92_08330 [Vicinamibacterales bacterium]|nr:hypothetical protein [Vicinamibacterales bacterium]